jgi:adenine-specific DNA-methyltransferase
MKEKIKKLRELVEQFERNIDVYKSKSYDEANTRTDFIDEFFKLLDWDIQNKQGRAEQYRDVVREDKVRIKGKQKAPDYSFRIGGQRKFFVEAKKPSVFIKEDVAPAFQVRRYGYTAELALSILTDFEEFAVYDTRIKPNKDDNANIARIFYCNFKDYEKNLEFIYNTFSKDAIYKGSFDKYIQKNKNRRGSLPFDKDFLKMLEDWRTSLAKNIALRNKDLEVHELNHAVQVIIDRIIFLRIAEEKKIEKYETLKKTSAKEAIYSKLNTLFKKADKKYNSGLFEVKSYITKLEVDDKVLKSILKGLYYPCPYEFSVLNPEILGQIYEQFLGKTIRLTAGHQAKIEEKPEVRKAGGVYYTPQYIVDYIVKNTVGEKVKKKTPKEVEKLTICDPACGSGSFLLGAYDFLLNWHLSYYTKDQKIVNKAQKEDRIYQAGANDFRLTIWEKRNILTNNIYGVDIDSQAVEVTKLSLLLKMMEDETEESAMKLGISNEGLLPNLSNNIKCGNSLIGSDFYEQQDLGLFDSEQMRKVNVFDWEEQFKEVFDEGGFDCVVGNPPYIRIQAMNEFALEQVSYFNQKYNKYVSGNYDIYILFIKKGFDLLRHNGLVGYILPHKFFQGENGKKIRKFINYQRSVKKIVDFSTNQIFEHATTYTCLLFLSKQKNKIFKYKKYNLGEEFINLHNIKFDNIDSSTLEKEMWNIYPQKIQIVLDKIDQMEYMFRDITSKIFKGSSTGNDKIFLLEKKDDCNTYYIMYSRGLDKKVEIEKDLLKQFIYGQEVRRYHLESSKMYLLFPYVIKNEKAELVELETMTKQYPKTMQYLLETKNILQKRKIKMNNSNFYKYSAASSLVEYDNKKIMIPDMLVSNRIGYDDGGDIYHGPAIHSVIFNDIVKGIEDKYFLGILNSKLFWFYITNNSTALRGDAYRLTPEFLNNFKFPNTSKENQKYLIDLVNQMLETQKKLHSAKLDSDIKMYEQKVKIIDKKIDDLVFDLYGLSAEERKIVSGS